MAKKKSKMETENPKNSPKNDIAVRRELYFAFMDEYNKLMGSANEHEILKEEVEVLLAAYS